MKWTIVFLGILALLQFGFSLGSKPEMIEKIKPGTKVDITGNIRLVGNEPFTKLVLTTTNGIDIYLPDEAKKKDNGYIGLDVRANGKIYYKQMISADLIYTNIEIQLSNAVIQALDTNYQNIVEQRKRLK